ncbi:hypothetical protein STM14_0446 [Salmonella enterica subsp. enterica serovar Typhimurium str. 14028S]|uniref:Uncharacterized protein n=2 Tax=Salmonella enterica I TaxID=59201 RepID=A0A0F6AXJ4_SALT1|nr:hypothetical protein SPAB_03215 [Salmonella enterica subsp. enterica serovar Paratyphi B str. SPB7]ACY86966.1 hypothetical protein STM14_0446 [Salmonella enterica subsp. enterica serovar Typhimurium str. 14028S]
MKSAIKTSRMIGYDLALCHRLTVKSDRSLCLSISESW